MIQAKLYLRAQIDAELWNNFIQQSPQHIIYANSGYLDSVCPGWSAMICMEGEHWLGVMPLNICRKYFQTYSLKPSLVQYLGIFFLKMEEKMHHLIHRKKIIIEEIIQNLPDNLKLFNHNFSPDFDYFIPFHWHKFDIRPMHSYHLPLENSLEVVYNNFSGSIRKSIRHAMRIGLQIIENNTIGPLIKLMRSRNIIDCPSAERLQKLWNFILTINAGFIIYIMDPVSNELCCGGAFLIDQDRVILIASALDYRGKKAGAYPLLVWKGIQIAHSIEGIKIFDFEGSMIRNIEDNTRGFGASPIVYYNISRNNLSIPYSIGMFLKNKFRRKESRDIGGLHMVANA